MEGAQASVARVVRKRDPEPLVRCTFAEVADRMMNVYGSCGAMIPFHPKSRCPSCGQRQVQATVDAPPPDADIIDGNVALIDADTGAVTPVQVVAVPDLANRIADSLRDVHWDAPVNARGKTANEGRLSGIVVTHRTFGYTPPVPLRRRYACSRSRFDYDYPEASALVDQFCIAAEHVFRTQAHEVYAETAARVREVVPGAWTIAGTPWTSGIINHTAALPYHRDSNNVVGSWSAMLSARRGVEGGMLHLADYNVWLAVPNGSISIFDGQSVVHGVTPFRLAAPNAYRFTLVCYARRGMRVCCPDPAGEAKRAAIAATEAVDRRMASQRSEP
jgi:hypothetical protein